MPERVELGGEETEPMIDLTSTHVADEPDEDGVYLLWHMGENGVTDKLGYVYAEWADELREALNRAR